MVRTPPKFWRIGTYCWRGDTHGIVLGAPRGVFTPVRLGRVALMTSHGLAGGRWVGGSVAGAIDGWPGWRSLARGWARSIEVWLVGWVGGWVGE